MRRKPRNPRLPPRASMYSRVMTLKGTWAIAAAGELVDIPRRRAYRASVGGASATAKYAASSTVTYRHIMS